MSTKRATDMNTDRATDMSTKRATDMNTDRATDMSTKRATDMNTDRATDMSTKRATDMNTDRATDMNTDRATDMSTERARDGGYLGDAQLVVEVAAVRVCGGEPDLQTGDLGHQVQLVGFQRRSRQHLLQHKAHVH